MVTHIAELVAELASSTRVEGVNPGVWPGMQIHRYTRVGPGIQCRLRSVSAMVVAQGRHQVTTQDGVLEQQPSELLILEGHARIDAVVVEASPREPFLSLTLELDPLVVRRIASDVPERIGSKAIDASAADRPASAMEVLAVALRARQEIRDDTDRRVLVPLYLQEIIYRLLGSDQHMRLRSHAVEEPGSSRVASVIEYVRMHLGEPLTVSDMAAQAHMSPSAFAHLFRDSTGRPPYRFLKEMRLDRARELLGTSELTVARVSRDVGYASVSQFIQAFRARFGMTPHGYRHATRTA